MSQLGHCVQSMLANPTNGPQCEVQLGQDLLELEVPVAKYIIIFLASLQ